MIISLEMSETEVRNRVLAIMGEGLWSHRKLSNGEVEIDMLKKKLLAESKLRRHAEEMLANVVNKDDRGMLAHCKGLEKKLAREQKKTRALEAINESLRHQLARQTCASVKVCNAETVGEWHASMPVPGVTQPLFECPLNGLHTGNSTMVAYSVGGRRGTDVFAPVQKDIRTWTRLTSSGVVCGRKLLVHAALIYY
jgi:hypothetical protein